MLALQGQFLAKQQDLPLNASALKDSDPGLRKEHNNRLE